MSSFLKRRCRWYWIEGEGHCCSWGGLSDITHSGYLTNFLHALKTQPTQQCRGVQHSSALCFFFSQLLNKSIHQTNWLNTNNSPTALSLRGIGDRQQMKVVTAQKTYSPSKASFWISSLIMESISSSAFPVTFSFLFILSFCLLFRRKHNQTHWKAIMQWKLPWKIRGPTRWFLGTVDEYSVCFGSPVQCALHIYPKRCRKRPLWWPKAPASRVRSGLGETGASTPWEASFFSRWDSKSNLLSKKLYTCLLKLWQFIEIKQIRWK